MATSGILTDPTQTHDAGKGAVSVLEALAKIFKDKKIKGDDIVHLFSPVRAVQDAVEGIDEVGEELATMTNEQSEGINDTLRTLVLEDKETEQDAQEILIGVKAIARLICRTTKKEDIETTSDGLPENVNVA